MTNLSLSNMKMIHESQYERINLNINKLKLFSYEKLLTNFNHNFSNYYEFM